MARLKYKLKLLRIKVTLYRKLLCVTVAGVLLRLAHKISPELLKHYDSAILKKGGSLEW